MYSKILNIEGRQRLVFFARQDLEVGQELTYNYRWVRPGHTTTPTLLVLIEQWWEHA